MAEVLEKTKKRLKNPLLNKKVQIALVKQAPSALYKDESQATLLTGASKDFSCPVDQYGNLIDPLEDWERDYLEKLLGINLSVHVVNTPDNPHANFWTTKKAKVILRKTTRNIESATITLDLSDPFQFILYKIALINPRVAKSWDERYEKGKGYEFVIKDEDAEIVEQLGKIEIEDTVNEYLLKIKKNKKKLFNLLRIYGGSDSKGLVTWDMSLEELYLKAKKLTKNKYNLEKLHKIITLGEKDMEDLTFIADAVSCGMIEKKGIFYYLMGGEKIGASMRDAADFLNKKINQPVKLKINTAIEDYYNNKK